MPERLRQSPAGKFISSIYLDPLKRSTAITTSLAVIPRAVQVHCMCGHFYTHIRVGWTPHSKTTAINPLLKQPSLFWF